jgi:hypothetical protein
VIGLRSIRLGPRIGPKIGPIGDDPLAGVTQDAQSGWYFPATAAESTALFSAAGITATASHIHKCDELIGDLADSVGTGTLADSGAGHLYGQEVPGHDRLAVGTVEGTAGQKWINSTVMPNPNTESTAYIVTIGFPAAAPAANRCLFANGGTLDCRLAVTTGRITIVNGASTTGAVSHADGEVHVLILQRNVATSAFRMMSDLELITGTFGAVVSNPMFALGGQTAAAADALYPHIMLLKGAVAEFTPAQGKTLITTMTGITPPWSP